MKNNISKTYEVYLMKNDLPFKQIVIANSDDDIKSYYEIKKNVEILYIHCLGFQSDIIVNRYETNNIDIVNIIDGSEITNETDIVYKLYTERIDQLNDYATKVYINKTMDVNNTLFTDTLKEIAIAKTFFRLVHPLQLQRPKKKDQDSNEETAETGEYTEEFIYKYNKYFYGLYVSFRRDLYYMHYLEISTDDKEPNYNRNGDYRPTFTKDKETRKKADEILKENYSDAMDVYQETICALLDEIQRQAKRESNRPIDLNRPYRRISRNTYISPKGKVYTRTVKRVTTPDKRVTSIVRAYCASIGNPKVNPLNFHSYIEGLDGAVMALPIGIDTTKEMAVLNKLATDLKLTSRETEVLGHALYRGKKKTAEIMGVSVSSVQTWRKRILGKAEKAGYEISDKGFITKDGKKVEFKEIA